MLISTKEYAELHGVSVTTVKHKIMAGNLPAVKIGNSNAVDSETPWIDLRCKGSGGKKVTKKEAHSDKE